LRIWTNAQLVELAITSGMTYAMKTVPPMARRGRRVQKQKNMIIPKKQMHA
jgi:hypothetical protein